MSLKVYITTELFDRDSKLVWRKRRRSKSFVQGFIGILYPQFRQTANTVNYKDTGGTDRLIKAYAINLRCNADAGDTTLGVVVGTGTAAVVVTDYSLATQIAHGVSSGQLSHSASTFGAVSISNPNALFTLQRDFTNSSGGSITVNEEGIYAGAVDTGTVGRCFCIIRDKEATGIAVADGQNLRVTYTIQTST